ncbi:MAG: cadherin domain-containing protein, partial [Sneathiellales bacterium]|nr:cadherin domain-containing protein [Sneathiellales bacterium]
EAQDSYSVTVDVFDGEHTTQQTFTIDVGDVNEAAHSVALDDNSVDENSAVGTAVGTVTADDPEGDTLSYSLSDDAGGLFTIDPNSGEIKVAGALDHEAQDSYSVTVDVFDGEHTTQQTFTIDVGDLAAPVLSGSGNTVAYAEMDEVVDLSHMDQFPELYEGTHLEDRVGSEVFDDMVDDAEKLVINYQSEATVTFKGETAGYRNSIGGYQINEDGTIQDVQLLWGDASSDKLTIGVSQATYTDIEQGSELGFFVISNGFGDLPADAVSGDGNTISETGTWMFVSPDFDPATQTPSDHQYNVNTDSGPPQMIYVEEDGTIHTQTGNVFHSLRQEEFNPDADVDSREHFVAGVDADNGILHFGIEDLMGGGDADFDDTMFSVEIDARDLVDTPNPLFAQDEVGRSTFQITDTDSTDLSDATVVVGDIQTGDSLTIGGGYQLSGGVVELPDGSSTGISYSIVDDGSDITVTLTGTASVDVYQSIIQSINFSNDGSGGDAAGDRSIEVSVTDSSGETSEVLSTSVRVATNSDTYNATENSDEYYGDGSDETIEGAGGDDYLHGGGGDDVLYGGSGDDEVYGGEGSDIFYFASDEGSDQFHGGEGSGWSDTIVLTDGMPAGDVSDWLTLTSGSIESTASGEIFLSEDAAGTISLDGGNAVLTFEGVEKIEA